MKRRSRSVLVAHPSPDVYGSDLQLLESVAAVAAAGWRVVAVLPEPGPLVGLLRSRGVAVQIVPYPVLRKSLLRPVGLARLVAGTAVALVRLTRLLRQARPAALYVNTVTNPVWLAAARLAGVPALCHVHEAEEDSPRVVRWGLAAPLLLARRIVTNSGAARNALTEVLPRLGPRIDVVHNGVAGPQEEPALAAARRGRPARLALVARLSPRKGPDVALDALGILRDAGRKVELDLYGSVFPGYEWFEASLRERAGRPDVAGHVRFHGYVNPTWPALAAADVVLVPSRVEPFGNTAVEAMLARRPVVASAVQGLREVIDDGRTGTLVAPADPEALAAAIKGLLDHPARARARAEAGYREARDRFSPERYHARILAAVEEVAGLTPDGAGDDA